MAVSFRVLGDFTCYSVSSFRLLIVFLDRPLRVRGLSFLPALVFCILSHLLSCSAWLSVAQFYWCFQGSGWFFLIFLFLYFMSICVFMCYVRMCMFVYIYVCACAYILMCTCLWRPDIDTGHRPHCFSLGLLKPVILETIRGHWSAMEAFLPLETMT